MILSSGKRIIRCYNGFTMSKPLTSADIDHIAALSHLTILSGQYDLFISQLSSILTFVSALQKVPTDKIDPTSQVTGLVNGYRDDVIDTQRILRQVQALSNAHQAHNGFFVVPAVFD